MWSLRVRHADREAVQEVRHCFLIVRLNEESVDEHFDDIGVVVYCSARVNAVATLKDCREEVCQSSEGVFAHGVCVAVTGNTDLPVISMAECR